MKFKFFGRLKKFMFPNAFTCDVCGVETFGENLCPDCKKKLTVNDGAVCPVCGRKTAVNEICLECKSLAPLYEKGTSPLVYDGTARILVTKFKKGSAYLKDYFADLIRDKLIGFPKIDCIVYVPMTAKSERKRGYNQSRLLAHCLSERVSTPVIDGAVLKVAETEEQKTLSRAQRAENLAKCFSVNKKELIKDKRVLVVDDVLTTGATADAMAKRLLTAGARKVYLATVASVEYKQNN